MVAAVSSNNAAGSAVTASDDAPSAALTDKLARCVKQLGDWQGCPSSKTPEGKKIIDNLRAQINSIQARISQSKQQVAQHAPPANTTPIALTANSRASGLGEMLDVYA